MSKQYYLPRVGDFGFYSFVDAFVSFSNLKLKCLKVSKISELTKDVNVYKEVYLANELNESIYEEHLEIDEPIALFELTDGDERYIPVSFINSLVKTSSVLYQEKMLLVNLGILPKDLNIEHLKNEISLLASNLVGKDHEISEIYDDVEELITEEKHKELEDIRLVNVSRSENPYKEIARLKEEVEQLKIENLGLSNALAERL